MTKKIIPLNEEQRRLVEDHLDIVGQTIRRHIVVNETIFGFSYDDLYQEGCIWLCKAAATFRADKAVKFETYATKVVTNGLFTYCRLMCGKQKRQCTLPIHNEGQEEQFALDQLPAEDRTDELIAELDALRLLHTMKQQYTGTIKLGIEAIEWKMKGFSGKEIADMYGVKPNLVGAWISRAVSRLKENLEFMRFFEGRVEKQP